MSTTTYMYVFVAKLEKYKQFCACTCSNDTYLYFVFNEIHENRTPNTILWQAENIILNTIFTINVQTVCLC